MRRAWAGARSRRVGRGRRRCGRLHHAPETSTGVVRRPRHRRGWRPGLCWWWTPSQLGRGRAGHGRVGASTWSSGSQKALMTPPARSMGGDWSGWIRGGGASALDWRVARTAGEGTDPVRRSRWSPGERGAGHDQPGPGNGARNRRWAAPRRGALGLELFSGRRQLVDGDRRADAHVGAHRVCCACRHVVLAGATALRGKGDSDRPWAT
jgi:hypothetical protein